MESGKRLNIYHPMWRHPAVPELGFGDKETCLRYLPRTPDGQLQEGVDPELAALVDERSTMWEVVSAIREQEGGTWDEYVEPDCEWREENGGHGAWREARWPVGYRWVAVYVVTGGSEGFYLHVDLLYPALGVDRPGRRVALILGKSLGADLQTCYESAGRIAEMLGA